MEKEKIVIDLKTAQDAQVLRKEEIIQREALEKLKRLIKAIFNQSGQFKEKLDNRHISQRYHNVITIDGDRGTGKSTFILNIFELIRKGGLFEDDPDIDPKIKPLGIIDPTLVEGMENVFITIISRIKSAVDECIDEKEEDDVNRWMKKLSELARGLPTIQGVGTDAFKNEFWDDHQYILQEGLISAIQAEKLERDFHIFVRESLKMTGKKSFHHCF